MKRAAGEVVGQERGGASDGGARRRCDHLEFRSTGRSLDDRQAAEGRLPKMLVTVMVVVAVAVRWSRVCTVTRAV
jgi:hypothetical protein